MSKVLLNIPDDLQEKLPVHRQDIGVRLCLEAAFSMCSRGVLSTSLAARLAGLSYTEFLEAAAREKVELFPVDFVEYEEEALRGYTLGRQRIACHPAGQDGASWLLCHLGSHIVIPDAAVCEVEGRPHSDVSVQALSDATWLGRVAVNVIPEIVAHFGLGNGEAAVLVYAVANRGAGAILDDQAARLAATVLGIPHVGTLGVVVFAKAHGLIPSARDVIEQLRQHGMYLSDKVMARALAQVGE